MTWFDAVLLLIIAQAAFAGYRRGFFSIMAGVVGLVVGVAVALRYYQPAGEVLNREYNLVYYLQHLFLDKISWNHPAAQVSTESFPSKYLPSLVQEISVPEYFRQFLLQALNSPPSPGKTPETIGGVLSLGLSQVVFNILVFLGIVLLVMAAAGIMSALLEHFAGGGVLGWLNRLAGMILNTAMRVMVLVLLCALLVPVFSLAAGKFPDQGGLSTAISGSWLVPRFLEIFSFIWQTAVLSKGNGL